MKKIFLWVLLSAMSLMLGAQSALAASPAVREMAKIMMQVEHYPGAAEKAKLKVIAADKASTEDERVIATAITDLKHHAAAGDVDKLKKVVGDTAAPAEVRDLAGIVLHFSHMPSAEDKGKLQMMMK